MATDLGDYTNTVPAATTAPSTSTTFDIAINQQFIREIVATNVVQEPKLQKYITAANSFFRGDEIVQSQDMLRNLRFGQEIRVILEKDQNPFNLYQKNELSYDDFDTCHTQLELECSIPCLNTLPEFESIIFRFDSEYAWGVRACDKNKEFYDFGLFTKQYALSREAELFGREVDLWNTVVADAIANPANTVDAALAKVHATHYWDDMGDVKTNGRAVISQAAWYLTTNFADGDYKVIMPVEMANALIQSVENPYNLNQNTQIVRTYNQWDMPGYLVDEQVRQILGIPNTVLILERSPWLVYNNAGTLVSQYPLWNADGTKQYCLLVDPRYGYQFSKDGYHLVINPYDCDALIRGMEDTEYVGSGTTFPQYALIIEFSPFTYA